VHPLPSVPPRTTAMVPSAHRMVLVPAAASVVTEQLLPAAPSQDTIDSEKETRSSAVAVAPTFMEASQSADVAAGLKV